MKQTNSHSLLVHPSQACHILRLEATCTRFLWRVGTEIEQAFPHENMHVRFYYAAAVCISPSSPTNINIPGEVPRRENGWPCRHGPV